MSGIANHWRGRLGVAHAPDISQHQAAGEALKWTYLLLKWTTCAVLLFALLNVAIYLVFYRVAMPFTYINGVNYGFSSYGAIEQNVNANLSSKQAKLLVEGVAHDISYADLTATLNTEATFSHTKNISDIWKLPLLQLVFNKSTPTTPVYNFDHQMLEVELSNYFEPINVPAVDARLALPETLSLGYEITPDASGQEMSSSTAAGQVIDQLSRDSQSASLSIKPVNILPAVAAADLEDAKQQAQELTDRSITITDENGTKMATIEPETFAKMIINDGADLAIDQALLDQYIHEELSLYFYTAPTAKRVDGGAVTAAGQSGLGLDTEDAKNKLSQALVDVDTTELALAQTKIDAPVIADGNYPKTNEGLSALLRDFNASKYGAYNLIVAEMKPGGLFGHYDATKSIIPASTYKAFVAYAALKAIDRGEFTMETMTPHGTIHDCMHEMIHVSTDHCSISIQDFMGWQKVDDMLRDAGFVDTKINNQGWGGEKSTTALDEYRLIRGLYDGSLLGEASTAHLINEMKNQMHRSGIPAGSAPATVADKVGFYAGRENDVGIVYAAQGDYIIIAMSHGGSFGEIAQLSRQVYHFFGN